MQEKPMKRDIFAELVEGFDTLASERQHTLPPLPVLRELSSGELVDAQATTLIRLVQQYPETLAPLAALA